MTMAWCFFFSGIWSFAGIPNIFADDTKKHIDMMPLQLVQALASSTISFFAIRILDVMADRSKQRRGLASSKLQVQGIKKIIAAIGILVGFAWEQCFDSSVSALSSRMEHSSLTKLVLAAFVFLVIVPAWKMWILPIEIGMGWLNPALASIDSEEELDEFIKKLQEDWSTKEGETAAGETATVVEY